MNKDDLSDLRAEFDKFVKDSCTLTQRITKSKRYN